MARFRRGGIQKFKAQQNGHHNRTQGSGDGTVQISTHHQQDPTAYRGGRGGRGGNNDHGRGGTNDRGRGYQIRGRGRGRGTFQADAILKHIEHQDRDELVKIVVKGLSESDVATDADMGLAACRDWIEERARFGSKKPAEYVNLKSPRWEGDDMVFEVRKGDAWRILKSDGQQFHGVTLSVQRADRQSGDTIQCSKPLTIDPVEKIEKFKMILSDRYDAGTKVLKLERLGEDIRLLQLGTWDSTATRRKNTDFFQGLMRLCESDTIFPSRAIKAEQVESVSLAHNDLTNLIPVLEIVKAFPDIRNLDLSHNKFKDLRALELLKWKFRRLDWLIISPNPIELEDTEYEHTITTWFPSLRTLNATKVRTDEAAASAVPKDGLPLAAIKDNFQDEAGIAESAVKDLLMGMDSDRESIARSLYDPDSTFSTAYNPSAPRLETTQPTSWEPYLKQSRNLKKVSQLEPRIRRMAKGIEEIGNALKILPPTRHPDLINERGKCSFDCQAIPGVPDPNGRIEAGVGGLKVDVRGSFEELDRNTGVRHAIRSFERVFILGPGKGENQLRIVNDILILRAYGGYEAFNPESKAMPELPMVTKNFGFPPNDKMEKEVKEAFLVEQISNRTGLTVEVATALLTENGWSLEPALENFKTARANGILRNHYFKPEVHEAATSNPTGMYY